MTERKRNPVKPRGLRKFLTLALYNFIADSFTGLFRNPRSAFRVGGLICFVAVASLSQASEPTWYWENDNIFSFEVEYNPSEDMQDSSGELQISQARLKCLFPVIMNDSLLFGLGFIYEGFKVDFKDTDPFFNPSAGGTVNEEDLPNDLHILELVIALNYKFNEDWSVYGELNPGIHSDFEDIDRSDRVFSAFFFFKYDAESGIQYRFGGGVTPSFGDSQIFPLFGMLCPIKDKFAIDMMIPAHIMFRYKYSETVEMGLKAKLSLRDFRMQDAGPWNNDILRYRQLSAGPYGEFILYETLILRVETGYMIGRKFEFLDKEYDDNIWIDRLDNKFFLACSLRWAF